MEQDNISPDNEDTNENEDVYDEHTINAHEGKDEKKKNMFSFWGSKGKKAMSREEFIQSIQKVDLEQYVSTLVDVAEGWDTYGWEFVGEENGITITRTSVSNSQLKCAKGVSVIKAKPKDVFEIIRKIEMFKTWDPKFTESKQIDVIDAQTTVNYMELAPYFPLAARDLCFLQHVSKDNNGTYVIAWHSVKHPSVPRRKGMVRAALGTSGFVISPLQNHSLVTFVIQFDLKGWIPFQLMNQILATQPLLLGSIEETVYKDHQIITTEQNDDNVQEELSKMSIKDKSKG